MSGNSIPTDMWLEANKIPDYESSYSNPIGSISVFLVGYIRSHISGIRPGTDSDYGRLECQVRRSEDVSHLKIDRTGK
jgi:hypothetical protein